MSDDPFSVHPLYNAWLRTQTQMLEAQAPFWQQMANSMTSAAGETDLMASTEKLWADARRQGQEWVKRFGSRAGFTLGAEGIAAETLERMMDPGQFMFAGSDEINLTIQKLVEGPEFSDMATLENQGLKATREWIALREASTEYQAVTAKAWRRAFQTFSKDMAEDSEGWKAGPTAITRRWLNVANEELIHTQRTKEFLTAQRNLLRAGVDYRLREREMVERWCETHSIPTRSEIDDLHAMVHELRREVRSLRKAVEASKSTAKRSSKSRTKAKGAE